VRVRILPRLTASAWCCRLLDKQAGGLDLTGLGMADTTLAALRELVRQPHGIILVTGPTGSGKTTTLYAALGQLDAKRTTSSPSRTRSIRPRRRRQTQVNPASS